MKKILFAFFVTLSVLCLVSCIQRVPDDEPETPIKPEIVDYQNGLKAFKGDGREVDYDAAFELFSKSAAAGCDSAQVALGSMYEYGIGVGNDISEAIEWYQKASKSGNQEAADKLFSLANSNYCLELPEESKIKLYDLVLWSDESLSNVNGDGSFYSKDDCLTLLDENMEIVYLSYGLKGEKEGKGVLNAKETATSLLLWSIPFAFQIEEPEYFEALKRDLSEMPETNKLAEAIDRSILSHGFLEFEEIAEETTEAFQAIEKLFGFETIYELAQQATKSGSRVVMMKNSGEYYGVKTVLESYTWNSDKTSAHCKFTVYNSNPIYLALLPGTKAENGQIDYDSSDISHLCKPQNSNYIFNLGGASGISNAAGSIAQYIEDTAKMFKKASAEGWKGLSDGLFEGMWNSTKTSFEMDIRSESDVLLIMSTDNSDNLFAYSMYDIVVLPLLKKLIKADDESKAEEIKAIVIKKMLSASYLPKIKASIDDMDLEAFIDANSELLGDVIIDILDELGEDWVKDKLSSSLKAKTWGQFAKNRSLQNKLLETIKGNKKMLSWVKYVCNFVPWALYQSTFPSYYQDFSILSDEAPLEGLVAYYPFNGNANDESGNGNHGILSGPKVPNLTTDRFGNPDSAYDFGGFNNYNWIKVPNSESLKFDKEYTMSFWIQQSELAGMDGYGRYSTSSPGFAVLCKAGDGNATYPGLNIMTGKGSGGKGLSVSTNNSNGNAHIQSNWNHNFGYSKSNYQLGDWLHIVLVVNNTDKILYLDGKEVARDGLNKAANFSSMNGQDLYIGIMASSNMTLGGYGSGAWYPFYGKIDDVRIYNRALTGTEVQSVFISK